jgi:hypothetical protein
MNGVKNGWLKETPSLTLIFYVNDWHNDMPIDSDTYLLSLIFSTV